jgi:AraC-like DNA-binding protein/mannose-6-phosphate isomerase-like protein (cupin superfamily)
MEKHIINLNNDKSEKIIYDSANFQSYIIKAYISEYPDYACLCHWHEDIEFIYVINGTMQYRINDTVICLEADQGLFVNSKQLHFGYSPKKEECEFICILLHPMLLCVNKYMEDRFICPITRNTAMPYIVFDSLTKWQGQANSLLKSMYYDYDKDIYPLQIQAAFYQLWILLYKNMPQNSETDTPVSSSLTNIKNMLGYIEENYSETIRISELAKFAQISESQCFRLFHSYLGQSPIEYINRFRLEQGIEFMKNTSKSLSEIALETGFSTPSYFSEQFKKYYGVSPKEYKKGLL